MFTTGKFNSYLHDVDVRAKEMYDILIKQLTENEGITEQFKEDNQMEWVGRMNNIRSRATEIVNVEVLFA